jgi:hypothetical protein
VLGFSTQDYLLRGGDALFLVVLFVALAGLGFARAHLVVVQRLDDPHLGVPFRRMVVALKVVGLALLVTGLVAVFRPLPFNPHFLFRSLSFGMGIVLTGSGCWSDGPELMRLSRAGQDRPHANHCSPPCGTTRT